MEWQIEIFPIKKNFNAFKLLQIRFNNFQDSSSVNALVCYTNAAKICSDNSTVDLESEKLVRDDGSETTCVDVFETGKK